MKKYTVRARTTGRYSYSDMDAKCVRCGSTLGKHEAEAPHANGDLLTGPECAGFVPEKKKRA